MNILEEKLYLEIFLTCDGTSCTEMYDPDIEATDPLEQWASRNASLATANGWTVKNSSKVLCPKCAKYS